MQCVRCWGLARIFRQGRARVGCDAVCWQGETTLRARAREEEQRGQRAAARLNRACSAWYKLDLAFEAKKVSIHAVLRGIRERPGEICGLRRGPAVSVHPCRFWWSDHVNGPVHSGAFQCFGNLLDPGNILSMKAGPSVTMNS